MAAPLKSTLPASWYREPAIFELEKRAIFGKTWLMVTHKLRLAEVGQYVRYEAAGYPFFLIKDRDGNINGYLNVCRHRAFPIVHEDEGKARILACKYHGWSYGLGGKLAKAPRFDRLPAGEFDKNQYSLYKVHVHVDKYGFVFVNLDSADVPNISWEEQFKDIDTQERIAQHFNLENYKYDHTFYLQGKFNWKSLVENYNECYHCPTAHPGFRDSVTHQTELPHDNVRNYILHLSAGDEGAMTTSETMCPTFTFPNSAWNVTKPFIYMMAIMPKDAMTCYVRYEVYKSTTATDEEFDEMLKFFKQVEGEDNVIATRAHSNLVNDAYTAGPLHPDAEDTVAYVGNLIRESLRNHVEEEKKLGKQIWPVRRNLGTEIVDEDEIFCSGVCDASKAADTVLAW